MQYYVYKQQNLCTQKKKILIKKIGKLDNIKFFFIYFIIFAMILNRLEAEWFFPFQFYYFYK